MTMRDQIESTRGYLLASKLPEDSKDMNQQLLDHALEAANGAEDKIAAIAECVSIHAALFVRHIIRTEAAASQELSDVARLEARSFPCALADVLKHPTVGTIAAILAACLFLQVYIRGAQAGVLPHFGAGIVTLTSSSSQTGNAGR